MKKWIVAITGLMLGVSLIPEIVLAQEVPTTLKQGMPYAVARKILLDAGWQAFFFSPSREKIGQMKYIIDKLNFYEVESCMGRGEGFCRFTFQNVHSQKLSVVTVNNSIGQTPTLARWWLDIEPQ